MSSLKSVHIGALLFVPAGVVFAAWGKVGLGAFAPIIFYFLLSRRMFRGAAWEDERNAGSWGSSLASVVTMSCVLSCYVHAERIREIELNPAIARLDSASDKGDLVAQAAANREALMAIEQGHAAMRGDPLWFLRTVPVKTVPGRAGRIREIGEVGGFDI